MFFKNRGGQKTGPLVMVLCRTEVSPDKKEITVNLGLADSCGDGYIRVEFYVDRGTLVAKRYFINRDADLVVCKKFPWKPEYQRLEVRVID